MISEYREPEQSVLNFQHCGFSFIFKKLYEFIFRNLKPDGISGLTAPAVPDITVYYDESVSAC